MKKILIGLIIILAATVAALKVIPVAAKSPVQVAPSENTTGVKPLRIIEPVKGTTTVSSSKTTSNKETVPVKKPVQPAPVKKTTVASSASVKWASSGLKAIGSLASFDYSTKIRNAYMRKVEAYAKSKNIKLITVDVVNSMHE